MQSLLHFFQKVELALLYLDEYIHLVDIVDFSTMHVCDIVYPSTMHILHIEFTLLFSTIHNIFLCRAYVNLPFLGSLSLWLGISTPFVFSFLVILLVLRHASICPQLMLDKLNSSGSGTKDTQVTIDTLVQEKQIKSKRCGGSYVAHLVVYQSSIFLCVGF